MLHLGQLGRQHLVGLDQLRDLLSLRGDQRDQLVAGHLLRRRHPRSHRASVDQASTDTPESPKTATGTSARSAQDLNVCVPFLLIRQAVIGDWEFFLDNEALFKLWVQRYGESGTHALASELRRLPWRAQPA
jgi:hypothetical protein